MTRCVVAFSLVLLLRASLSLDVAQPRLRAPRSVVFEVSRRQAVASTLSIGSVWSSTPIYAEGQAEARDCNEAIYLVLRVQEATQQEERLVRSGKFKDLQRANVKFAVNLMLTNYQFLSSVNQASTLSAKSYEASMVGREAVEALQQILEYFDSAQRSLQVETLSGEKLDFVLKALQTSNAKCDKFLTLLPAQEVERARRVVEQENNLNLQEYEQANPGESYLNPALKKSA